MTSKQALGLAYELLSVNVLRKNGFSVDHCGRKGDKGIDFKGNWTLSDLKTVPVIGESFYIPHKLSAILIPNAVSNCAI